MEKKHKMFISYHQGKDEEYKDKFVEMFGEDYFIDKPIYEGDIDSNLKIESIREKIRDDFITDATVTVVLIGTESWKRKYIDWEIASSISDTKNNTRTGLIGILLPSYFGFNYSFETLECFFYDKYTIPPRLSDNITNGFVKIYEWSYDVNEVKGWIQEAFNRKDRIIPNNSFPSFTRDRTGEKWCTK